jgi:hypothetical protein
MLKPIVERLTAQRLAATAAKAADA